MVWFGDLRERKWLIYFLWVNGDPIGQNHCGNVFQMALQHLKQADFKLMEMVPWRGGSFVALSMMHMVAGSARVQVAAGHVVKER